MGVAQVRDPELEARQGLAVGAPSHGNHYSMSDSVASCGSGRLT